MEGGEEAVVWANPDLNANCLESRPVTRGNLVAVTVIGDICRMWSMVRVCAEQQLLEANVWCWETSRTTVAMVVGAKHVLKLLRGTTESKRIERVVALPPCHTATSPVLHIRHFETILYELIYLVVSLKVVYIRDPGETQSVILRIFNRQLTHRRLE